MRLRRYTFAFPLAALAGFVIAGCPDDKTLLHPDDVADATTDTGPTPTDSGTDAGDGGEQRAFVRLAHLAVGDTSAIDVCIGKVSANDAGADAGDAGSTTEFTIIPVLRALKLAGGIKYKDVTKYFDVTDLATQIPTGDVVIRIVEGTATNCTTPKAGTTDIPTNLPAIERGTTRTIAALGPANALVVKVFTDHTAAGDASSADVRFVNAALPTTGKFDFSVGANAGPSGIDFGGTAANNDGYVALTPLDNQTVTGRPTGSATNAFTLNGVTAAAKSLTTVFAIGAPATFPVPGFGYAGLACKDSAPPVGPDNNFTDCGQVVPGDAGTDAGDSGTDAGDAGDGG